MAKRSTGLIDGGYPEQKYWLVDDGFRIETPVDERGLVDTRLHIDLVIATLSSDIDWSLHKPNIHHFYWPEKAYPNTEAEPETLETTFRNLVIHKGKMPIQFHNWLHYISEPPAVPGQEVMEYRVESWNVASELFKAVRSYKRKQRSLKQFFLRNDDNDVSKLTDIEREVLDDLYDEFFDRYPSLHSKLLGVPEEFRLVDPNQSFENITKEVGKIVGAKALFFTRTVASS